MNTCCFKTAQCSFALILQYGEFQLAIIPVSFWHKKGI